MKEIFLSFRPEYIKPILYGLKKYEYRKRFCNEETKAYLYLSGKTRKVIGIMELGKPIHLDKTRNNYIDYPETLKRVDEYILNRDTFALPIKTFTLFTKPITLEELRTSIPKFMPPQMYYVLENNKKLKDILEKIELQPRLITHEHKEIYYDNLALSVSEIIKSKEYKELNEIEEHNKKFITYL